MHVHVSLIVYTTWKYEYVLYPINPNQNFNSLIIAI